MCHSVSNSGRKVGVGASSITTQSLAASRIYAFRLDTPGKQINRMSIFKKTSDIIHHFLCHSPRTDSHTVLDDSLMHHDHSCSPNQFYNGCILCPILHIMPVIPKHDLSRYFAGMDRCAEIVWQYLTCSYYSSYSNVLGCFKIIQPSPEVLTKSKVSLRHHNLSFFGPLVIPPKFPKLCCVVDMWKWHCRNGAVA